LSGHGGGTDDRGGRLVRTILYDGRHGALMFMRQVDAPQGKPLVGYPEK